MVCSQVSLHYSDVLLLPGGPPLAVSTTARSLKWLVSMSPRSRCPAVSSV